MRIISNCGIDVWINLPLQSRLNAQPPGASRLILQPWRRHAYTVDFGRRQRNGAAAGGGIFAQFSAKRFGPSSNSSVRNWFAGFGVFNVVPASGFFGLASVGPLFGPPVDRLCARRL